MPKKVSVCLEKPMGDLWTHQHFFLAKCFILFFTLMNTTFVIISSFFSQKFALHILNWVYQRTFLCKSKNKVFLGANPQKSTKVRKCFPKKFPEWFSSYTIDPFFKWFMWWISSNWYVKKYFASELHSKQILYVLI